MRRLVFIVCAIFAAGAVVFLSSLSAKAQTGGQYEASGGEESSGASPSSEGFVSQGSVADADSPGVVAAREDLAEEERLPDYSQVVDNTTKGAFRAPGWKVQRGSLSQEGSFVSAEGAKAPARFKLKIPTTNDYSVYAWWPKAAEAGTARYGVQTASGMKWSKVEQRADSSGMWVKIGTYTIKEGRRSVQVAAKSVDGGRVFADAVAVVRGEAAPPEDPTMTLSGERSIDSMAYDSFTGWDVVRKARSHLGDRYRYGTCTWSVKSCTCLTKKAVNPFGHSMGMTEGGQWRYEGSWRVWMKRNLRPGDEIFFKEDGSKYITHVGIYSGNGNIVHASSYFGKVVEREMKYVTGYYGAKRFKSR